MDNMRDHCRDDGSKKGEGCGGFIIGLLLGPFGILIALFSKGNRKQCPYCKELMHKEAKVCPHCQKNIVEFSEKPKSFMDGLKKGMEAESTIKKKTE